MPQRTLRVDIQVDDVFVKQIEAQVKSRWSQMTANERQITSVLIKALNEARQAKTEEFRALLPHIGVDTAMDAIIESLRANHAIPVIVSVGRGGGYRLPVSRAECQLYLQAETNSILRKVERLVSVYDAMTPYGMDKPEGMDALITLTAMRRLQAIDRQQPVKHERKRR